MCQDKESRVSTDLMKCHKCSRTEIDNISMVIDTCIRTGLFMTDKYELPRCARPELKRLNFHGRNGHMYPSKAVAGWYE